jgi:predicted RNase H-like HicB family nuclease
MAQYPASVGIRRGSNVKYAVVYERAPRNWAAYVPDLPGCIATGETRAEVERLIREAISLHLESMQASGEAIPRPSTGVGLVEV